MKLKQQKGFTIIEVLIVLAIAGLILLIVFLAVPALQRNSRNTSARNDAAAVLGGVSEFQAANNGALPTNVTGTGTITYAGTSPISITIQGTTQVLVNGGFPGTPGIVHVQLGVKCDGTSSTRAINAKFKIESRTGFIDQCVDS